MAGRSRLGPDLVFIVLTMNQEEVRKRLMDRHNNQQETVNFLMVSNMESLPPFLFISTSKNHQAVIYQFFPQIIHISYVFIARALFYDSCVRIFIKILLVVNY